MSSSSATVSTNAGTKTSKNTRAPAGSAALVKHTKSTTTISSIPSVVSSSSPSDLLDPNDRSDPQGQLDHDEGASEDTLMDDGHGRDDGNADHVGGDYKEPLDGGQLAPQSSRSLAPIGHVAKSASPCSASMQRIMASNTVFESHCTRCQWHVLDHVEDPTYLVPGPGSNAVNVNARPSPVVLQSTNNQPLMAALNKMSDASKKTYVYGSNTNPLTLANKILVFVKQSLPSADEAGLVAGVRMVFLFMRDNDWPGCEMPLGFTDAIKEARTMETLLARIRGVGWTISLRYEETKGIFSLRGSAEELNAYLSRVARLYDDYIDNYLGVNGSNLSADLLKGRQASVVEFIVSQIRPSEFQALCNSNKMPMHHGVDILPLTFADLQTKVRTTIFPSSSSEASTEKGYTRPNRNRHGQYDRAGATAVPTTAGSGNERASDHSKPTSASASKGGAPSAHWTGEKGDSNSQPICNYCKKPGHIAADCFKKKNNAEAGSKGTAQSASGAPAAETPRR